MLVYRLQNKNNNRVGAYFVYMEDVEGIERVGNLLTDGGTEGNHPSPRYDEGMREKWNLLPCRLRPEYHFGCSSPSQFLTWFFRTDLYERVDENSEAAVAIYSVDEPYYIEGNTQTVFHLKKSELVECISLSEFKQRHGEL